MRSLVLGGFLFVAGVGPASAVTTTLDFEDLSPGSYGDEFLYEGWRFTTGDSGSVYSQVTVSNGAIGCNPVVNLEDTGCSLRMERADGQTFSLHGALYIANALGGFFNFRGHRADGHIYDENSDWGPGFYTQEYAFDPAWEDLTYVTVGISTNISDAWFIGLDDVSVSYVPIPAAAWLFGSALIGLGWIRRTGRS